MQQSRDDNVMPMIRIFVEAELSRLTALLDAIGVRDDTVWRRELKCAEETHPCFDYRRAGMKNRKTPAGNSGVRWRL